MRCFATMAAKETYPMSESLSVTIKTTDWKAEKHVP